MVSPTFGGGHQMEMQFGAPQINMQHMPPGGGHQMEMLRQPLPTSIPPPQMNSNQFPVPVGNQNPAPDLPGEHQMESQQEQKGQENDSLGKPVESSSTVESDDGDKMDICDTWEQEKVQRLAEEVEKFEQEVMNIERNSLKMSTDNTAVEKSNTTSEAERTADSTVTEHEKECVDEAEKKDSGLPRDGEVEREAEQSVIDNEVKTVPTEDLSKVDTNDRETGEGEGQVVEAKQAITEIADNQLTSQDSQQIASATESSGTVEEESKQTKTADEKPSLPAEENEATSFDDAMDLQDSSPEPSADPSQLSTDNA